MTTTTFDIDDNEVSIKTFPKFILEILFKHVGLHGDTARIAKAELLSRIMTCDRELIEDGIRQLVDDGDIELQEAEVKPVSEVVTQGFSQLLSSVVVKEVLEKSPDSVTIKEVTQRPDLDAVQSLIKSLGILVKPSLNEDQIRMVVAAEVSKAVASLKVK